MIKPFLYFRFYIFKYDFIQYILTIVYSLPQGFQFFSPSSHTVLCSLSLKKKQTNKLTNKSTKKTKQKKQHQNKTKTNEK